MLDGLAGGVTVVAHGGADTRKLAGGNRHPGATSAHNDAAIDLPVANGGRDGLGDIRIVDRRAGMGAQVEDFMALLGHDTGKVALHLESGVVGANGDSHASMLSRLGGLCGFRRKTRDGGGAGKALPGPPSSYTVDMKYKGVRYGLGLGIVLATGAALIAQGPPPQTPPAGQPAQPERPTFTTGVTAVSLDAIVRNNQDVFVADLKKDEFEIYEDGVKQDVTSFTLVHGGRVHNLIAPPPPPTQEGIILPPSRPRNDAAGRIFLIIVDDLHLDFRNTGRIRDLFKRISNTLVHDGDMFAIVSTGPSSLAIDPTYDRKILDDSIKKITGNGLKPSDIIQGAEGAEGPSEVRYRANVAFSTAHDMLTQMERISNRRKAVIWVSNGYDFDPFAESRLGEDPVFGGRFGQTREEGREQRDQFNRGQTFADADLARELGELTRTANRANATIYTIDPRGLVAGADLDEQLDPVEYGEHVRKTQDSLRVIAEETGGIAVVNQNDFSKALKRIDNETSDYYILGYTTSNPDPLKRSRKIEVKVTRPEMRVISRTSYSLKQPPKK
jgi:VWFA-related protein